jgi:hypothetical protein
LVLRLVRIPNGGMDLAKKPVLEKHPCKVLWAKAQIVLAWFCRFDMLVDADAVFMRQNSKLKLKLVLQT